MPVGKVRHVGDIVAMIAADTLDHARDAAEALVVDYEELPAVVTVAQALAPGAVLVHDDVAGQPDVPLDARRGGCRGRSLRPGRPCDHAPGPLASPDHALHGDARGLVVVRPGRRPRDRHLLFPGRSGPAPADVRESAQHSQGEASPRHRGCRRRLRTEIPDLCRIDPARVGDAQAETRPALERRAGRACTLRQPCTRPDRHRRTGTRQGRPLPRRAGEGRGQFRRLCVDGRAHDRHHRSGEGDLGPVPHPRDPSRFRLRLHQHRAGRRDPRRGQARGAVPAGAAGRYRRARNRPLAGRSAPAQPAHAGGDAPCGADRLRLRRRRLPAPVRAGPEERRPRRLRGPPRGQRGQGQTAGARPLVPLCTAPAASPTSMSSWTSSPTG